MKHVPNILSVIRLIAIIPLLLLTPFKLPFMIVYVTAGVSDMIDGPIARKFKVESQFGAALDGGADVLLVLVVVFRVLPLLDISSWLLLWILIAIGMKLSASVIGYIRHKQFIFLHTYGLKFFIFMLFLFPIFYAFMSIDSYLIGILTFAMLVFVEDIYINLTSTEVNLDHKGILFQNK